VRPLLELFLLAIAAAFYPTLLAIVVIMLGQPRPTRLLGLFLLGAAITSVSIGLVIVFALAESISADRTQISAGASIVGGALGLLVGAVLLLGPKRERRARPQKDSRWKRLTASGFSGRLAFVLGIVLDLPGIWYLMALKDIGLSGYSEAQKVLLVIAFNVVMYTFLEVPFIGYLIAPEDTAARVDAFQDWMRRNGRTVGGYLALAVGAYLVVRGIFAVT